MRSCPRKPLASPTEIGFPVLVRPSYVLGGRAMVIAYDLNTVQEYVAQAALMGPARPVLIDQFLEEATEVDVDALADGEDVVIGGVMEHIEEAGVHSGDSSCVLPPVACRLRCSRGFAITPSDWRKRCKSSG